METSAEKPLPVDRYPCLWPEGCASSIAFKHWCCRHHWHQLPPDLQSRIFRTFKPGQRLTHYATQEYLDAMRDLEAHIHRTTAESVS